MKNIILTALFLAITLTGFSQTIEYTIGKKQATKLSEVKTEYIEIVGMSKSMWNNKIDIMISFGQKMDWKDQRLFYPDGSSVEFFSMVGALNFLAAFGYKYHDAYTISTGGQNVYHYILKREEVK